MISRCIFSTYVLNMWVAVFITVTAALQHHFQRMSETHLTYASASQAGDSSLQCVDKCVNNGSCYAVSFSLAENRCELSDKWITHQDVSTEVIPGWNVYYNTDDCLSSPCLNGGNCENSEGTFTCACVFPWKQNDCSWHDCLFNPCNNGGTCSNTVDSFTCTCAFPWKGDNCEIQRTWECHLFTEEEWATIYSGTSEVDVCESDFSKVYTWGNEALAPGCSGCWCCKEVF